MPLSQSTKSIDQAPFSVQVDPPSFAIPYGTSAEDGLAIVAATTLDCRNEPYVDLQATINASVGVSFSNVTPWAVITVWLKQLGGGGVIWDKVNGVAGRIKTGDGEPYPSVTATTNGWTATTWRAVPDGADLYLRLWNHRKYAP